MKIPDCIFFYEGNPPVTVVPITKASNAERVFVSWCQNALRWRHNDHAGVSNHQPHGCLLNRLFRRRSKKTPKLRVTGLCAGNSPGPVNSPHKGPVTRKMFPSDDVIMGIHGFAFSHKAWSPNKISLQNERSHLCEIHIVPVIHFPQFN